MDGFEEFGEKLNDLAKRAESLHGNQEVALNELLTPGFLAKNTHFLSAEEMLDASGFKVEAAEDFAKIPDAEWDQFIQQNTLFDSWNEMLSAAVTEWTRGKLGFDQNE